jgi:hypothetical protein
VAGVHERDVEARRDRDPPLVPDRLQVAEHAKGVGLGVQRQRGRVPAVTAAVGHPRIFLGDPSRVGQDDTAQVGRWRRTEDAAPEPLREEPRKVARVIDVRVSEDDCVDRSRRNRQIGPVAPAQLAEALEQATIHQDAAVAHFDEVLRPGDGAGSAQEGDERHG